MKSENTKFNQSPSYPSRLVLWLLFAATAIMVLVSVMLQLWLANCHSSLAGAGATSVWHCGASTLAADRFLELIRLPVLVTAMALVAGLGFCLRQVLKVARELERLKHKAEAADAAKSEFLATVTHELRTPLNGVLGIGEVLRTTNMNKRQLELLAVMMRSGRGLLDMINDLLDVARIEAGKLELHTAPTELGDILRGVDDMLRPVAAASGLDMTLDLPQPPPPRVHVDSRALRQVLVNLVGNAIKFTESGGVKLSCTAKRRGDLLDVEFVVKDSGLGIAPENLSRIFERFYQEVRPQGQHLKGTGLGLAISDEIIRKMGGRIEVVSTLGQGSSFTIFVALKIAEPAA